MDRDLLRPHRPRYDIYPVAETVDQPEIRGFRMKMANGRWRDIPAGIAKPWLTRPRDIRMIG